ncbi:nucleotidyltransferase family protein [Nannocystis radixulma]|uniref:Nucleotidyltransferase domain-containing protein n=1 Tax=Nannocystis radixulma TaxID=2995305 RepID=A0ABT5B9D2_9BACT|nr:nucleotidyltransferase domain-containing protein [Nannocystis radixulma]MDC0670742.1 nucleotidyltransferase domain-containing protein [Nannocystis radixulma]
MAMLAPSFDHSQPEHGPVVDLRGVEIDLAGVVPLLEGIIARWHPTQVWLFGSRARGDANETSDWDLFVVVPDETPEEELDPLVAWQLRKHANVRADIVPCHRHDFETFRDTPQSLAYEAAHQGVLLYER